MTKSEYDRERYLRNREAAIKRANEWNAKNHERRREIVKRHNEKARERKRNWHQIANFGHLVVRDNCEMCGTTDGGTRGLVIHHRDGCNGKMGTPLNNDRENLVVLCRPCHAKVHGRGGLKEVVPQ